MSNNTYQHVSNESKYVKFDPTGSNFPGTVTTVQSALSKISNIGVNGIPDATMEVKGIAMIASEQEVLDGTNNSKIVTPATLATRLLYPNATETKYGLTRYSTNEETLKGSDNNSSITPQKLKYHTDDVFKN
ncbi:hypothetical protein ACKWME_01675, partial [Escherichia coli]